MFQKGKTSGQGGYMIDKGWVSHNEPQSFDVILCSEGLQLSTVQGNGSFFPLGHTLDCIDRYFEGCVAGPSSLHLLLVLYGCAL